MLAKVVELLEEISLDRPTIMQEGGHTGSPIGVE